MALYSMWALVLATCVKSWPQISFDEDLIGGVAALPSIPYTAVCPRQLKLPVDDVLDGVLATLPVPKKWKRPGKKPGQRVARQLPAEDVADMSLVTLPVPVPESKKTARRMDELAWPVRGRQLPAIQGDTAGLVTLPVIHSTKPGVFKRAIEVQLANRSDVAYYAQLNIGTPPQPVFVQLDTGSFELWVNPDCSNLSQGDMRFCQAVGNYDPARSSTAGSPSGNKTLRYGIGAANITYIRDSISLPGSSVMNQVQFGMATGTEDQFAGILGIGYGEGVTTRYKNFVDELATQGVTKTRAFSLALGSKAEQEGAIIFGGVDTAKFAGTLSRLPIIPAAQAPDRVPRYWVRMNSLSLTPPSGRSRPYPGTNMAVFLDSGATLTLLPPSLANAIAADFGATGGVDSNGFYPVDCGISNVNGTLDFAFDGITIRVPYREMIREIRTEPPSCWLGIVPSEDFVLLGDTFLRSAYVVFDPDSNLTYMAAYSNCGSQVMRIDNPSQLVGLTGACSIVQGSVVPGTNASPGDSPAGSPSRPGGIGASTRSATVDWWLVGIPAALTLLLR